jgi:hypothetical protein
LNGSGPRDSTGFAGPRSGASAFRQLKEQKLKAAGSSGAVPA